MQALSTRKENQDQASSQRNTPQQDTLEIVHIDLVGPTRTKGFER
jgi:hypothetical protein